MRSLLNSQQVDDISQNELYQRGSLDCKDGPKYDVEHRENIDALYDDTTEQKKATLKEDGDVAQRLFASQNHEPIDSAEEARVVRKIDFMILPYLAVCYAFFYIDKTTLSYAAIFGIREDLKIHGQQYSWLSSIFYFGFLAWALPTNFLMQRFPIGKYLGANIFMWGALLMCQAAATNFTTLAVLRALSGAAEACSDPAFMIITSMWYSRRQQPIRMYTANGFGIALGGLLGYGIGHIKAGLPSWKFEFLIIGALCSIWGIVMMIFLPDSPVTAKGLDEREKRIAVERLRDNQTGIENKHLKWYQVREAFTDYKTYLFFVLGFFGNVPNGGISNFGTIIIKGFGFSTLVTTLMQVPYGILIAISILVCVFLNDKFAANGRQTRCYFILLFLLPNISGSFGLAFLNADNKAGRLMCYYLTGPYNAAFVMVLSLTTANVAGHSKKVVTNAVLFLGYCAGNIAGPFFYKTSQSPRYQLGIWSMIVSHLAEVCIILLLRMLLSRENNRRDRIQSALPGGLEGRDLNATAFADLTDRENENFRYIY
ncbi:MFS general substrate transporter [Aureobasidium pullulans]|uniref:MFS general substrate transporter n=1 Tax=Aureobasidium pullulans TaxID=5580 RepID=A0A4S9DIQ5_AURPU|nr:MFS general substrate transporter [Aureobasidium pullulans]THX20602.1 MFS general substrate transporter [Aureobasidium pullulans]THX35083.1 MFS general substrate transporter [Aureobasidium pullulans]THY09913.1 MFS general substrate transporter [Aureobasidium pullulans]